MNNVSDSTIVSLKSSGTNVQITSALAVLTANTDDNINALLSQYQGTILSRIVQPDSFTGQYLRIKSPKIYSFFVKQLQGVLTKYIEAWPILDSLDKDIAYDLSYFKDFFATDEAGLATLVTDHLLTKISILASDGDVPKVVSYWLKQLQLQLTGEKRPFLSVISSMIFLQVAPDFSYSELARKIKSDIVFVLKAES